MGNLIETVLQDAVLVSVQGNGEVCAQCVQMICIERHVFTAKALTGYTVCMQEEGKMHGQTYRAQIYETMQWKSTVRKIGLLKRNFWITATWRWKIKSLKCPPWASTQYVACLYSDCLIHWTVKGDIQIMSNPFSICCYKSWTSLTFVA